MAARMNGQWSRWPSPWSRPSGGHQPTGLGPRRTPEAVAAYRTLGRAIAAVGLTPCQAAAHPDAWHGERTTAGEAAALCGDCPVIEACLGYALAADEREGVWGGQTAADRRRLAQQRARAEARQVPREGLVRTR